MAKMIDGLTYEWRDIWTYIQTDIEQTDTCTYKWMEGQESGWKYMLTNIMKDLLTGRRMDRWTDVNKKDRQKGIQIALRWGTVRYPKIGLEVNFGVGEGWGGRGYYGLG